MRHQTSGPQVRIILALCCLLIAAQGLIAQEVTAPPPPPSSKGSVDAPPPPTKAVAAPPTKGSVTPPRAEGNTAPPPAVGSVAPPVDTFIPSPPSSGGGGGALPGAGRSPPAAGAAQRVDRQPADQPTVIQQGNAQITMGSGLSTAQKRGLYGGFTLGLSVPWYAVGDFGGSSVDFEGTPMLTFGGFLGWHIARVGVQLEALFNFDTVTAGPMELSGTSMLIPIIVKYDINLGPLVIQPLIGPYFNIALGELDAGGAGSTPWGNPPLGFMLGGDFGLKLRKGMFFLDARLAFDMGNTVISFQGEEQTLWRKSAFTLALGYQFN